MATGARPENTGGQQGSADAGAGAGGSGGGAPGAGAAAAGGEGQGGGTAPAVIDREKLPPALRNLSPEQITDVWDTVFNAAKTAARADSGRDASGVPAHARPAPAAAPPPPTKEQLNAIYKEYLDPSSEKYDPAGVFNDYITRNYGGLLGGINRRSVEALFGNFRNKLPDFAKYEDDIANVLSQRDPATLSENDILGSYYAVKGYKATESERAAAASASTRTAAPSPPRDEKPDPVTQMTDTEKAIARALYPNEADPYKKYAADAGLLDTNQLDVPIGGGKKG